MLDAPASLPPVKDDDERIFALVIRLTSIAMLITLAIKWRAYFSWKRIYTMAPLVPPLAQLPISVSVSVFGACLLFLLWLLIAPRMRLPAAGVLACQLFWGLQDVIRLQPSHYMFCYVFLVSVLSRQSNPASLNAIRTMICGVYFWAGFHKINATFYLRVFPWFVQPFYDFSYPHNPFISVLANIALYTTPFFEAAIGILLIFPRSRALAAAMAFMMLIVVLACLGPLGHDWGEGVWPWNLWLFLMEYRLFYASPIGRFPLFARQPLNQLSVLLFVLAPVLAMWSTWYTYAGFKLYSGNKLSGEVLLSENEMLMIAPYHMWPLMKKLPGGKVIDLREWSMAEGRFLFPTRYAFQKGAAGLCPYLDYPETAKLRLIYPAPFYNLNASIIDMPLCTTP